MNFGKVLTFWEIIKRKGWSFCFSLKPFTFTWARNISVYFHISKLWWHLFIPTPTYFVAYFFVRFPSFTAVKADFLWFDRGSQLRVPKTDGKHTLCTQQQPIFTHTDSPSCVYVLLCWHFRHGLAFANAVEVSDCNCFFFRLLWLTYYSLHRC